LGVARALKQAMEKHGLSPEEAAANFHVLDHKGLVTAGRGANLDPAVANVSPLVSVADGGLDCSWRCRYCFGCQDYSATIVVSTANFCLRTLWALNSHSPKQVCSRVKLCTERGALFVLFSV
jgi:hypothetical protein